MASYLWQRGGTWFFQLRPPNDSRLLLGATPVRVRLPFRTHREAIRCARHLAGVAEQWLMMMRYRGFARMRVLAAANMFRGVIFTPVLGIGLPHLVAGIGQTCSLLTGAANRPRFFRRTANGEIVTGKPGLSLGIPERAGLAFRSAVADLLRKRLRTSGD